MLEDILSAEHWDKPLWCVYGHECFPQILCCKLTYNGTVNIWGYSVYRRSPGFRTLGIALLDWIKRHQMCNFYDDHEEAIAEIKRLTTPKVKK